MYVLSGEKALQIFRRPRPRPKFPERWLLFRLAVLRANDARHEKPLARDGTVTPESLGQIYNAAEKLEMLKAKDYPQEKWPFVLRLMSLFQFSFPLDEDGQKQLVPALLPVEEPSAATEPDGEGRVRLRYDFNVVPAPLLPRLLVRTFGLIKNALHWRRGALLSYRSGYGQSLGDAGRALDLCDDRWLTGCARRPYDDVAGDPPRPFC